MQPLRLEIFPEERSPVTDASEDAAWERQDQSLYETGYQAGWEDALAARDREKDVEAAEVTRALQALDFTFHDARAHLLRGLAPLFEELAARLLPKIAMESLPHLIAEVLMPFAEAACETPVELLIHPAMRETVAHHLASLPAVPVELIDQHDQPTARITLRFGERETRIDVEAALEAIDHLLLSYFAPPSQDARHG